MDENTTTTTETKADGNINETASIIERADGVAKRMEEANKKAEELLNRQEAIAARMMLSGRANAGEAMKTQADKDKELIDKEVKARLARF